MDQISHRKASVVVVTNERQTLDDACSTLRKHHYNVVGATSGPEALDTLKRRSVDIMLVDFDIPQMPGLHLAQTASRMFPDLSVVLVTPGSGVEAARTAIGCGASDYISMPLTEPQLVLVVERNLDRRNAAATQLSMERSQVLFSAIKALAAAIDAKSEYTATHSSRVTALCISVGKVMGLPGADMATLELAAQIHDIGNIGTPDEVLDKPGTLTDVEWVDILRHPDVGSSILSHVPALSHIASIVRHHHERYDGAGYPDGLSGDAIPMLSRIITIADAYEAMTADRPYRLAKSHEDTIRELRTNAGKQFDPTLLERFIAAVDDLEAGRKAA
ncbi:MAG: HD domain-containing phosphohydrolase [Armatimonadota bacterium]|nr:HD domain-containing phosphohydrolase [Armatimonadota bacterium]